MKELSLFTHWCCNMLFPRSHFMLKLLLVTIVNVQVGKDYNASNGHQFVISTQKYRVWMSKLEVSSSEFCKSHTFNKKEQSRVNICAEQKQRPFPRQHVLSWLWAVRQAVDEGQLVNHWWSIFELLIIQQEDKPDHFNWMQQNRNGCSLVLGTLSWRKYFRSDRANLNWELGIWA